MNSNKLEIIGAHGPVSNRFLEADHEPKRLGVVFPGRAYSSAMPVLYYPRLVLETWGASVLTVDYNYTTPEFAAASDAEQDEWVRADARAAINAVLEGREYDEVVLVGKSIGTISLAAVLEDERLRQAKFVWLTPLVHLESVTARIQEHPHASLFVIGSEDPVFDRATLERVRIATNGELVVIEGGDHTLEIEGDVQATIRAQLEINTAFERFLAS